MGVDAVVGVTDESVLVAGIVLVEFEFDRITSFSPSHVRCLSYLSLEREGEPPSQNE